MKVLIFECWNKSPQLDTGLEIAENHVAKGDNVTYVNIGKHIPFLEWQSLIPYNTLHNRYLKLRFDQKFKIVKRVINPEVKISNNSLLSKSEVKALKSDLSFKNLDDLKKFHWKGIDIGMAVTSSLISVTNDLNPDTSFKYKDIINRMVHSSKIMATSFEKWIDNVNPDLVYFRNGRVASYKPIYRICQQRGIDFRIHDRGCNKDHYTVSPDLRHFFDMINQEVVETWDKEEDVKLKEDIAYKYYTERQKGVEQGWKTFIEDQKKYKMPENWDKDSFNIVYFNSSISEYAAVNQEQFSENIFSNQVESIHFILDKIKNQPDVQFYLRCHPNIANQDIKERELWNDLSSLDGINVISPLSDIDTYSLVSNADLIIVHYSTVGMEAAYLGKPVIQLSKSEYYTLGSTYFPKTKDDFEKLILDRDIKPLPNKGAKMYGYYLNTYGTKHKTYNASSFSGGTFKGVNLQKLPFLMQILHDILLKIKS